MSRTHRSRQEELDRELDRQAGPTPIVVQRQAVQVYDGGNLPNTTPRVFLTRPILFDGSEAEGSGYTVNVDSTRSIPVLVLGTQAPSAGDNLVATGVGGRWVAERGLGGGSSCQICVIVTDCVGAIVSGATVSITGPTSGTCTTDGSGVCCVDVTAGGSGTYTIAVSKTGYYTTSQQVAVTCPGTTNVSLKLTNDSSKITIIEVKGCGSAAVQGAIVTLCGTSQATDSMGRTYWTISINQTCTLTISKPGYTTYSGPYVTTNCVYVLSTYTLSLAAGFVCCGTCPVPQTLYVTDGCGTQTITWNGSSWVATTPCLSTSGTILTDVSGSCICAHNGSGTVLYSYSGTCASGVFSLNCQTTEIDCAGTHYYRNATCAVNNYPAPTCSTGIGNQSNTYNYDLAANGCPSSWSFTWPAATPPNLGHPCVGTVAVTS